MSRSIYAAMAEQDGGVDNTWFRNHDYDPPFLLMMSEEEHTLLLEWHKHTIRAYPNAGSSGVEMMTMLTGLILSTGIDRIVQCGHYVGFSTLVLGFIGRRMGSSSFLYSVDVAPEPSAHTASWVAKAGLDSDIKIAVRDSSDPLNVEDASAFLGGAPQLVYIDSSHQYEHTMRELNLWWDALPQGGLLVMDDISLWASEYDSTGLGGSHRAALEFCKSTAGNSVLLNGNFGRQTGKPLVYTDVCGFGLIQKPY
jgi:predicted O-methyltransferase YrrM